MDSVIIMVALIATFGIAPIAYAMYATWDLFESLTEKE